MSIHSHSIDKFLHIPLKVLCSVLSSVVCFAHFFGKNHKRFVLFCVHGAVYSLLWNFLVLRAHEDWGLQESPDMVVFGKKVMTSGFYMKPSFLHRKVNNIRDFFFLYYFSLLF